MAKRVAEKGVVKEKRVVIRPDFYPQIKMPSGPELRRLARAGKITAEEQARMIMGQRQVTSVKNTSKFYVDLFRELYESRILEDTEMPLFTPPVSINPLFLPDVVVNGHMRTTFVEVKAISDRNKRPFFGHRQFAGYCGALLNNPGSKMLTGIFCYGGETYEKLYLCAKKKSHKEKHKCDNRCLVEKLSHSTNSLLVLPHNVLSFLLMLTYSVEMDQKNAQSSLGFEHYKRPYKAWMELLVEDFQRPFQTMQKILEHAHSHYLDLWGFKINDFYLEDLEARSVYSPDNLYCYSSRERNQRRSRFKIKPFPIIEYTTPCHSEWMKYFSEKLDLFLGDIGIKDIFYKREQRLAELRIENKEREAIKKEAKTEFPKKPPDDIPF